MKRLSALCSLLIFTFSMTPSARSAEIAPQGTLQRKLQRGFLNIALSPFEISHEIVNTQKDDSALPTWIAGTVKGSAKAVGRVLVGAYEIVTLPVPLPRQYAPILQPEFPWDLLDNNVRRHPPSKAG